MTSEHYLLVAPEEFFSIVEKSGDLVARFQKDGRDHRLTLLAPDDGEPVAEIHVVMGGDDTSLYFRAYRTDAAM